jgi:hypothetical protein
LGVDVYRVDLNEAWALCPAHLERTGKVDRNPSWSINLDSGIHNCFSCEFKGNFSQLVRYLTDEDPREWIRDRGGFQLAVKKFRGETREITQEEPDPISEADLALFVDPPEWALAERDMPSWAAQSYGVLWDSKKECWIFPVRDPANQRLRGWQEKSGHKGDRYFSNYPRRLRKKDTFFGIEVQPDHEKILLVEAPISAVRGFAYADIWGMASMGAKFTQEQVRLLARLSLPVVAAFDLDRAGELATQALHEEARGRMSLSYLDYGDATDLDDMSGEEIRAAVDRAIPSYRMSF